MECTMGYVLGIWDNVLGGGGYGVMYWGYGVMYYGYVLGIWNNVLGGMG